ncbi:MAG: ribosome-associated translation inhibitor RaiA [Rhodobacteraceae bacterium]|nr:ribosome-associated translation inhibitor RaiA [Paracoccaceae bacterium]
MRYQISGKQIDIGEALQTHVKTELGETVGKYAGRPTDANVIFSKSGHEFVCECIVHLSTGLTCQARDHANDIYAAFDGCNEKMDKQAMIIAETETKIPSLSVGEAVMQMELAHGAVQVFRNEKHGGINVVYRRDDGNIGWIDPR